jgi:hypothetical protein
VSIGASNRPGLLVDPSLEEIVREAMRPPRPPRRRPPWGVLPWLALLAAIVAGGVWLVVFAYRSAQSTFQTTGSPRAPGPVISSTSQSPASSASPLKWRTVPAASLTPEENGFALTAAEPTFWAGATARTHGCDYTIDLMVQLDPGSGVGFGVGVRAKLGVYETLDNGRNVWERSLLTGHGLRYEGGFGYNDMEELAAVDALHRELSDGWHRVRVSVSGSSYEEFVDGRELFAGTTKAACGAVWVQAIGGTAHFKDTTLTSR